MKQTKKTSFGLVISLLLFGIITPLFSPYLTVKAQTGYLDVYVYDNDTLTPIGNAVLWLYDEYYTYLGWGMTDISGFYNFTGLSIGGYYIEISATGYRFNDTYVTIDFEGEGKLVEFYQELLFTPGNGFIDVYVYDSETMNPIPDTHIILCNDIGDYITEGYADVTGYYNFTGLGVGVYTVEAHNVGYTSSPNAVITIDFDGEAELAEIYLDPAYVPGIGFIDVYVFDNDTLTPIENADVWLYDEYGAYIDSGMTDIMGFYNFTGLGIGDYIVEADADGYIMNSSAIYIDYDGEGEYLMLYLQPFVRTLDILYPTDSQTVEGGLVLVGVDASESIELQYIDVYVNAEFITKIDLYGTPQDFFVPVFENGTNTIYLEGYWNDMSTADATVDINSINVIPMVDIKEDDYLHYIQYDLVNVQTYEANFTFTTWLSTFEMLTHYSIHQYDSGGTIMQDEFWLTINVLNGYVSIDPSGSMLNWHFFPFACLPPTPVVGDKSIWVPWNNIMTINGSITWEYTEVWTLDAYGGMMVVYVEKISNIVHYLLMPGMMEMRLLNTSIDFPDPFVSDVADFAYVEGDTGNTISWVATDMFPATYVIYKDSVEVDSGMWNSVTPIGINVDGLTEGTYVYLIVVSDRVGNTAQDTVTVTVNPVVPEFGSHNLIFIPIIALTTYFLVIKRKKNNK